MVTLSRTSRKSFMTFRLVNSRLNFSFVDIQRLQRIDLKSTTNLKWAIWQAEEEEEGGVRIGFWVAAFFRYEHLLEDTFTRRNDDDFETMEMLHKDESGWLFGQWWETTNDHPLIYIYIYPAKEKIVHENPRDRCPLQRFKINLSSNET